MARDYTDPLSAEDRRAAKHIGNLLDGTTVEAPVSGLTSFGIGLERQPNQTEPLKSLRD